MIIYNVWKALTDSPFYDKYATIFDQVRINAVKSNDLSLYVRCTKLLFLTAAFDRNGVANPISGMTQAKISSYSSAKSIMVGVGKQNLLMINNKPVTMVER